MHLVTAEIVNTFFLMTVYSSFILTDDIPVKSFVLATDYDKYLLLQECNQFPRDNPFLYEQHNFILSRQAVWKGKLKEFQKALDKYASFGIDPRPFTWHEHEVEACERLPEIPV